MRIQITAGGIYGADGEIPIGTKLTVKTEPTGWAGRYTVLDGDDAADEKTAVTNPAGGGAEGTTEPAGPFEAKDKGEGWWAIYDGKGEQVGKSVRKADGEAFNGLSDDDKVAYAAEHAKA